MREFQIQWSCGTSFLHIVQQSKPSGAQPYSAEYKVELAGCVLTKHEDIIHVPEPGPFVRSTLCTLPHLLDGGSKLGK